MLQRGVDQRPLPGATPANAQQNADPRRRCHLSHLRGTRRPAAAHAHDPGRHDVRWPDGPVARHLDHLLRSRVAGSSRVSRIAQNGARETVTRGSFLAAHGCGDGQHARERLARRVSVPGSVLPGSTDRAQPRFCGRDLRGPARPSERYRATHRAHSDRGTFRSVGIAGCPAHLRQRFVAGGAGRGLAHPGGLARRRVDRCPASPSREP